MRYIRLKNEIIDVYSKFGFNQKYCDEHEDKFEEEFAKYAINEHVIKRSNSIEKLCDEFVVIGIFENQIGCCCDTFKEAKELKDYVELPQKQIIYGAIWTDKGLIYVAKMNKEGKLELL